MGLTKAKGNMYPWVTHLWNPISGQCPHQCEYCYVKSMRGYKQPPELTLKEPFPALGKDKTIFVGHMNDMFADAIPDQWITRVLEHCIHYPANTYVFQTKNPQHFGDFFYYYPPRVIFGTTIETNRNDLTEQYSHAPHPMRRWAYMKALRASGQSIFVTLEPIMTFDIDKLAAWLIALNPDFVNIGADSKGHNLPEPTQANIGELVCALKEAGIEVRLKENLKRLFPW